MLTDVDDDAEMPMGLAETSAAVPFAAATTVAQLDVKEKHERSMVIFAQHRGDLKPKHGEHVRCHFSATHRRAHTKQTAVSMSTTV